MGLLDTLQGHAAARREADYAREGEQPTAAAAGHLADRRIEHAVRTAATAHHTEELRERGPVEAPLVVELTRPIGNDEWEPAYYSVPVGQVVEVLGRDELRDTCDITNQSAALLGTACTVFLFRRETDAQKFANGDAAHRTAMLRGNIRAVVLPDAAGRTLTHTAPTFAVAVDIAQNGATEALVDVSAERRRAPRP